MTSGSLHPRPDQISELTRGIQLPLPEISSDHLQIIAEGLAQAFFGVQADWPATVSNGSEAEVTALLESRLNRMIESDPLLGNLVLSVARGKESLSFDGTHLEKRPDLSICLSNQTRGFPLLAEAKIIDAAAAKTEALYCDNGIARFVKGEYAWGNREAFMLAYVRDGSSIATKLNPFLSTAQSKSPPGYATLSLPAALGGGTPDLAVSSHDRLFVYPALSIGKGPGAIAVWHLWLS